MKRKAAGARWYVAHLLIATRPKKGPQRRLLAWEAVHLISAATEKAAAEKARLIGRRHEGDDEGSLLYGGRPAIREFVGIRKLVSCWDDPGDEAEITYFEQIVPTARALKDLADGKDVSVVSTVGPEQRP